MAGPSASDQVAALPGGAALAQIAAQVTGDATALSNLANTWTNSADHAAQHTTNVTGAVSQVVDDWHGSAAAAFSAVMQQFATASSNVQRPLLAGGQALTDAATALTTAQQQVEAVCESVLKQASAATAEAKSKGSSAADLNAALSQITANGVTQAQPYASQADTKLQQIGGVLADAVTAIGKSTFSSLPVPTSDSFSPEPTGAGTQPVSLASAGGGDPTVSGIDGWIPGAGPTPGPAGGGAGGGTGGGSSGSGTPGSGTLFPVSAGGGTPAAPAQVKQWIQQAIGVLEANGVPASALNANDIWTIIQHESGGNPDAVNNWDSNAAAGTPSEGLMQTIEPTFNAYALPGHGQILNPVDNIIAGVRYAITRYGSLGNVPGVVAVNNGRPYVGY